MNNNERICTHLPILRYRRLCEGCYAAYIGGYAHEDRAWLIKHQFIGSRSKWVVWNLTDGIQPTRAMNAEYEYAVFNTLGEAKGWLQSESDKGTLDARDAARITLSIHTSVHREVEEGAKE
jgi:hypothetical protein